MVSYAILGATGNTGQALLNVLSQSPDKEIHAYVRSKAKLLGMSPGLDSAPNVKIFEGPLHDTGLLAKCMQGTTAVFLVVATNDNAPGCTIAQETAHMVIAALEELRSEDATAPMPRLIVLSSASIDEHLSRNIPHFAHMIISTAASYVYADLVKAEAYLRGHQDLVKTTFVKPGGLVHDAQKGHVLSTDRQQTFVSFLDLAAAMVEVADSEGDTWDMKNVSVLPTANNVKIEWRVIFFVIKGILLHFFPSLWPYLKS